MSTNKSVSKLLIPCRNPVGILALLWLLSICIGIFIAHHLFDDFYSLMHTAASTRVSIVGVLLILLFPVISSAVAVSFSSSKLIYLICTLKGICHGFGLYTILAVFGYGGWLIRFGIMFSECMMLIPLFYFWIRLIDGTAPSLRKDTIICCLIAILVGVFDYFVVSPYIIALMRHI